MRRILIPAVLAGLLVSACGDDTTTGGNGGGGDSPAGGGGVGGEGATGGINPQGGGGEGGIGASGGGGEGGVGGNPQPVCGDGSVDAGEDCDDNNTANTDGCSANCEVEDGFDCTGEPSDCSSTCGDGVIADGAEECDDNNMAAGDGCSDSCQIENGWSCMDEPSVCMTGCGDGIVAGTETCDDMNMTNGDGCSDACATEPGYACMGEPSVCALAGTCMTPIVASDGFALQVADPSLFGDDLTLTDGSCVESTAMGAKPDLVFSVDLAAGDTLHVSDSGTVDTIMHVTQDCMDLSVCLESFDGFPQPQEIDPGLVFQATTAGTYTVIVDAWEFTAGDTLDLLFTVSPCGDGVIGPGEGCDDMNTMAGDGCSATCAQEAGFDCTGEPSVCTALCGNGQLDAGETCDDMNTMAGDGCSMTCTTEMGFICNGEPSVCTAIPAASCAMPIMASDGFSFGGTNFGAFLDDLDFPDASCADVGTTNFNSADAVFAITLNAGQRVRVRNNAAQPDLDTVIQALGTTCGGNMACLGEFDDPEATGLTYLAATTGTHFFVVEAYSDNPPAGDNFNIEFDVATCGDGVIEFGEQCDQGGGNVANGDGCSSTCAIEPGFMCTGTPSVCTGTPPANCASPIVVTGTSFTFAGTNINAFGDTENYNAGTSCVDVSATLPSGFDVVFRADLLAGQTVRVRELGTLDAVMHILQAPQCGAGVACAASTDGNETTGIAFTAAAAGPVFIVVESFGNPTPTTTYDIRIDITQCGDGVIGGTETCDDGNAMAGDGCSAACVIEAGFACDTPGGAGSCYNVSACADDIQCYLGPCPGGTIVTASAMGLPLAIPDGPVGGGSGPPLSMVLPVAQTGTVRKAVMRIAATHPFDGDLDFSLTSPAATLLDVCSDNGGSGDNFGNMTQATFLRDGVVTAVTAGTAPFAGVFRPETAFSTLTGQSVNGNWTITAVDDANTDVGTLTGADLAFCVNP